MKQIFKIFGLLIFFLSAFATAQVMERTVTVENPDTTGKVSVAQLTDQANQKMAEDLVIEFLGNDVYARNKTLLTTRVIQNSGRFTPFQRAQEPERGPFGVRLTVLYKVSLTDFRKLLTEAGLFSKTRLANHVISFVAIEDESGNRIAESWKKTDNRDALDWMREWNDDFKKVFEKAGYSYNKSLNPAWIESFGENISAQDVLNHNSLANCFILWGTGKIVTNKSTGERTLIVQSRVYSQDYKREVTDSARRFTVRDDGHPKFEIWAQDLVAQLDEIDAKSLTQGSIMKLVVNGSIPLTEQDQFKQLITNSSSLIKTISERRFESNQIVYEIESDANVETLAQKISTLDWKGKKLAANVSGNEIRVEIAP
jgi:hypothetical protein